MPDVTGSSASEFFQICLAMYGAQPLPAERILDADYVGLPLK